MRLLTCVLPAAALLTAAGPVPGPARADQPTDRQFLNGVAKRLVAAVDPPAGMGWPPTFDLMQTDQVNAFAGGRMDGEKFLPQIHVTAGFLDRVVAGDEDRLALVVGHELGHIVCGHCSRPRAGQTEFLRQVFSREQEAEADRRGMEIALKAGFSLRGGLAGLRRMAELGLEYNSFEGLGVSHPSWKDRLAQLDRDQPALWRAMSAFDTGAYFLLFEQYPAAERCFRAVVKEFPTCPEGWANLGYAELMQYCDALDPDDLRAFGIGPVVVGGFYRRPASLEARVRGPDEELWWEAVGSLREALRLSPDSAVARADLGVAHLLRPAGRNLAQARRLLDEAADRAGTEPGLHLFTRAAILHNAGVAAAAAGDSEAAAKWFAAAEATGRKLAAGRGRVGAPAGLAASLRYNRAALLAGSDKSADRTAAAEYFESYLAAASPASAWWPLAYDRYSTLSKSLGRPAKAKDDLAGGTRGPLRLVAGLAIGGGESVTVGQPLDDARRVLGPGQEVPVVKNTKLRRVRYPARGIELIATDTVLAVCLAGPNAPPVPLRATGTGSPPVPLKLGMTAEEVEKVLGDTEYDYRELDQPGRNFRFYPDLGLAVRVAKGRVEEIAIVQLPRRNAYAD